MFDDKPQRVSLEMKKRLRANRRGKLTTGQWLDMVTEPLAPLLLLMVPALMIVGPRIAYFLRWLPWLAGLFVVLFVIPMIFRARRYARRPLCFARLWAQEDAPPWWMFWRPQVLYTQSGEPLRFDKRLAPRMSLHYGKPYIAYYLEDPDHMVLLSIAPADHPEAEKWHPAEAFKERHGEIVR